MDGKVIIVGWVVVFEIVCGIIMHGLQYHLTESSSMGVVIIFNCYRALLYSLSSVYIRCNYPIQVFGTLNGALRITMGIFRFYITKSEPFSFRYHITSELWTYTVGFVTW